MGNLQTQTSGVILERSTGSALTEIARVRAAPQHAPAQSTALMGESLQRQVDGIIRALTAPLPPLTEFNVVGPDGSQIAWIGNNGAYLGAWFKELYIGGTSAATASIVADPSGNITIQNATITLNLNGVTTVISNGHAPSDTDVESLTSIDNASGDYSYVNPLEFQVDHQTSPGNYQTLASIGQANGNGLWRLHNSANTARILGTVFNSGAVSITMLDTSANTLALSPSGLSGLHIQNVGTGDSPQFSVVNATSGYKANGTSGISFGSAFGVSLTVNTGNAITSVAGAGITTTNGTFVTGVTLNLASNSWSEGLLTA